VLTESGLHLGDITVSAPGVSVRLWVPIEWSDFSGYTSKVKWVRHMRNQNVWGLLTWRTL
jgi:hypothetical protein